MSDISKYNVRASATVAIEPMAWLDVEPTPPVTYYVDAIEFNYYNDHQFGASTDLHLMGRLTTKGGKPDMRRNPHVLYGVPTNMVMTVAKENGIDIEQIMKEITTPIPPPDAISDLF